MYESALLLLDIVFNTHNLKEERLHLSLSLRGFSPCLAGSKAEALWWEDMVEQRYLADGGWKAEQGQNAREEGERDHQRGRRKGPPDTDHKTTPP